LHGDVCEDYESMAATSLTKSLIGASHIQQSMHTACTYATFDEVAHSYYGTDVVCVGAGVHQGTPVEREREFDSSRRQIFVN
jgi:hypothetical protein